MSMFSFIYCFFVEEKDKLFASIVNSYDLNGMGVQAIELYRQRPQEMINEVTRMCFKCVFTFRTC